MSENGFSKNPFLFVGGVPRSGTTLLQRMLNNHPQLAVTNDSHFIPRALEKTNKQLVSMALRGDEIMLNEELKKNVYEYHRFRRLELTAGEFAEASKQSQTFQQLVSAIYDRVALKSNKMVAGEKTPGYVRRFVLLNALFPNAKLIHILRDGRNVALSLLSWATPTKGPGRIELWNQQPIAICALWWRWMIMTCQADNASLDSNVQMLIRYENLVTSPELELRKTCDFLGLQFDPQMLEYHRDRPKPSAGLAAKNAWFAPRQGLRDWKRDMTDGQIQLFEALAGDALTRCGYELNFPTLPEKTLQIAQRCRGWWIKHFARDNTLAATGSRDEVVSS